MKRGELQPMRLVKYRTDGCTQSIHRSKNPTWTQNWEEVEHHYTDPRLGTSVLQSMLKHPSTGIRTVFLPHFASNLCWKFSKTICTPPGAKEGLNSACYFAAFKSQERHFIRNESETQQH